METKSITCPACGMTSRNPNDAREGYCGNCHAYTAVRPVGLRVPRCTCFYPIRDAEGRCPVHGSEDTARG